MTFTDYLQTQPLLRVAVALMAGITAGDGITEAFPALPPWSVWLWYSFMALCLILELLSRQHPYRQSALLFMAVFVGGIAMIDETKRNTVFPFSENEMITYEAVVISEPQMRGKTLQCDLALTSINGKPLKNAVNIKAAILRDTITNDWKAIALGTGLRAQSIMQPVRNFHSGNFNYVRWLHIHGFRATTFIYYSDWNTASVSLKPMATLDRMRLYAMQQRQKLVSRLRLSKDGDQQSAVVAAMVLGEKHAISHETKEAYSVSGASHILALSGLHLSIIYSVLLFLIGRGFKRRWLSQAIILLTVWGYVFLVGMGASVVRSAVMLSIYSMCVVSGRDKASVNALSLAAICLLVANPLCLWDIGFEMSFMAVLGILMFYKHLYRLLFRKSERKQHKNTNGNLMGQYLKDGLKAVWGMVSVSVAAQISTAPLVAYYFGRFSCYFLLTNFIVIPCATLIIYLALAIFITAAIPPVNTFLLSFMDATSTLLNNAVRFIASLPHASLENIHTSAIEIICVYILIAIACIVYSHVRKLGGLIRKGA